MAGFPLKYHILEGLCQELSESQCRELGFTPSLVCGSCSELSQFNLSQLEQSCRQCCVQEDSEEQEQQKYPYAELVVCS